MAAGTRVSRLLHELVPETTGQIRGHIVIESTRPLVAQQLFGDYPLQLPVGGAACGGPLKLGPDSGMIAPR